MDGKVFYVTKEKLKELQREHQELVAFEHAKTVDQEAPKILESEDLNSEFVSYHEDMDSLRSRIDELNDILEHHEIIKAPGKDRRALVDLGATVKVDLAGKEHKFTLVGTLEANPDLGKIINESPVGKALLGKKVGDQVVITWPNKKTYTIKHIHYES